MANIPLVMRVMATSISTARGAGKIIRDVMSRGALNSKQKAQDDYQTEADRSAQTYIVASLLKEFPTIKVIGEEEGLKPETLESEIPILKFEEEFLERKCPAELRDVKDEDIVVWVDPLDGTSEYMQGFLEHVTVLIGVAIKNAAVGGVLHQPYFKHSNGELGRTIWGLKGLGTGGFEAVKPPDGKLIVTTTRSHSNALVQEALDSLAPSEVLRVGGAGFKVLQLLEGKAHAYVFASPGCKKWDTCAPEAILEAQGGVLTDMQGNHYSYSSDVDHPNKLGVFATHPSANHFELLSKIPENVKQSLQKP